MMAILLSTLVLTRPRAAAVGSAVSRGAIAGVLRVRRHTTSLRTAIRMQQGSLVEAPPSRAGASPDLLTGAASAEGLHLLNSLTQTVEAFTPIDPRLVKWYVCGPTVYDSAHVGHARNYVAFDIVRRVLLDYFGFDLLYVMNITDIDDKIIVRTHYNHLESMVRQAQESAAAAAAAKGAGAAEALAAARQAAEAVLATPKPGLRDLLEAQHVLAAAAEAAAVPLPVCDVQAAFLELTAAFEAEFFDDMARLNVLPPDAVTRVSDYVPEIIAYIETIRSNGYCYESRGSVYFDTEAFRNAPGKQYGKLDPAKAAAGQRAGAGADDEADDWTEGKSSAQLLAEGEGALSADAAADKRHPADFVLWKASKAGEPSWASPWGLGRPGWHIECSAMASDLLGSHVDLNAGGVDLKFPHHENQIAQAEAHFDCCSWVNYFLHSGHLRIEGLKMSKSLKNFITIDGALSQYSAAQLRFLFLLRRFSEPMEYSENTLAAAVDLERRFSAFGASLSARLQEATAAGAGLGGAADAADAAAAAAGGEAAIVATAGVGGPPVPLQIATHKWGAEERTLHATLHSRRQAVHSALLDSIDTPTAFKALEQLLRATNVYMSEVPDVTRGFTLLTLVQRYFGRMFQVFGLPSLFADGGVGAGGAGAAGGGASAEQVALALSTFRDQLRQKAIAAVKAAKGAEGGAPDTALAEELLRLCDALRDDVLPQLGVQLDDRPSGVAQLQMGDPKVLKAEMERRAAAAAKAAEEKAAKAAAKAAGAAREAARTAIPPSDMFKPEYDALFERPAPFGALDAEGVPLEDASGEPLSKSQRKKLIKEMEKQAKLNSPK